MLAVFLAAAVIWGLGAVMKTPKMQRYVMLFILYIAVLGVQFAFPDGHELRRLLGGSLRGWLIFGGIVALVLGYMQILRRMKNRVKAPVENQQVGPFSDTELNRYARHIVLREVGGVGQKKLKDSKVLVVGAGGLGSPALLYLAAAGVGTIGVVDDDQVENSNLQRQVIHQDGAIGTSKVQSAAAAMQAQNPFVVVRPYERRLTEAEADALIAGYDIVLDGTDNFETRYLVNQSCVRMKKPLISGALTQWEGQLSVFDPAQNAPCYQCVFPEAPAAELAPNCAMAGVIGPLPGVVGSMMAVEAIKVLTGAGETLRGQMLIYDALYGESRKIALKRREGCPICGS
ncbi:MAG: HesA/MoeB/ThiF family protein [Cognatishimia sp.]